MIQVPVMPCCGELPDACECAEVWAEVWAAPVIDRRGPSGAEVLR
ncbi:hypothetical protein [Catenuloplanes atrovinosus]|uniref:Uncharacterized protein n=1 Tax=Catenuloplanes atrovinosus TaxID=137266 RepID=A0AAE3YUY9_9ACTN|nr:hypothetical protein [Catenuloplanes atrovinosus]MDR7278904.1 hypothetical protein [Catenuloplanes atrovinosus]